MEQANTPHTSDPQDEPGDEESTRPQSPADTAATSADTTTPPIDDTDFEPV